VLVALRFHDDPHWPARRHLFATGVGKDTHRETARFHCSFPGPGVSATSISVAEDASALVLTITGPLDAEGGRLVRDAAAAALDAGDSRRLVEVDLRSAEPLTVDGLRALAGCAAFGRIRFRFGTRTTT
jgi:hypothetical protein